MTHGGRRAVDRRRRRPARPRRGRAGARRAADRGARARPRPSSPPARPAAAGTRPGRRRLAPSVVDAATGEVLLDRDADRPAPSRRPPRSSLTAVAALTALDPPRPWLTTGRRRRRAPARSSSSAAATRRCRRTAPSQTYPGAATVADLAAQVVAALPAGTPVTRVVVDSSLFTGPLTARRAGARPTSPSSYAAPVTATVVDGGRVQPRLAARSGQPGARRRRRRSPTLLGAPRRDRSSSGEAPAGAETLARSQSAPSRRLVEQALLESATTMLAEALARQVALARTSRPRSTARRRGGRRRARRRRRRRTGVDARPTAAACPGCDRVPAGVLTAARRRRGRRHPRRRVGAAVRPAGGRLRRHAVRPRGDAGTAPGAVRAKTGTLTGVHALAGTVRHRRRPAAGLRRHRRRRSGSEAAAPRRRSTTSPPRWPAAAAAERARAGAASARRGVPWGDEQRLSMVDWDLAVAPRAGSPARAAVTTREEAAAVVGELHEAAAVADAHVEKLTGLTPVPAARCPRSPSSTGPAGSTPTSRGMAALLDPLVDAARRASRTAARARWPPPSAPGPPASRPARPGLPVAGSSASTRSSAPAGRLLPGRAEHRRDRAEARRRPVGLPALGVPARGHPPHPVHRGAVAAATTSGPDRRVRRRHRPDPDVLPSGCRTCSAASPTRSAGTTASPRASWR